MTDQSKNAEPIEIAPPDAIHAEPFSIRKLITMMRYFGPAAVVASLSLGAGETPGKHGSGIASNSAVSDSHKHSRGDNDGQDEAMGERKINSHQNRGYATTCRGQSQTGTRRAVVEAAGIEPASRDISMKASTCVVDYLGFRRTGRQSTGY